MYHIDIWMGKTGFYLASMCGMVQAYETAYDIRGKTTNDLWFGYPGLSNGPQESESQ